MSEDTEKLSTFPAFFKVAGREIVVVGNGDAAFAKLRLLSQTEARLIAVSEAPFPPLRQFLQEQQQRLDGVIWRQEAFTAQMIQGAVLVFTALGTEVSDGEVREAARAHNIPVNVVDKPHLCDFYTPTLVNRAPVAVAIGSEGAAPVLTQLIRAKIETLLPRGLGRLARYAALWRDEIDTLLPRGRVRRWFWKRFFAGSVARVLERGNYQEARGEVERLIASARGVGLAETGQIIFIDTVRTKMPLLQELLLLADHIIHDESVSPFLVAQGRRDAYRHARRGKATETAHFIAGLQHGKQMVVRMSANAQLMAREMAALEAGGFAYSQLPSDATEPMVQSLEMAA